MIKETMNLHKALSELKILNDRISDKISNCTFCGTMKSGSKTILGKTVDEFKTNVQSDYDSVNTLINRRNDIKRAVSKSNASTSVKINGKDYVVAEAIEMKNWGMDYYKDLLRNLRSQYASAVSKMETENAKADMAATDYAKNGTNSDKTALTAEAMKEMETLRKSYYESHKIEIVDPLKLSDKIKELEEMISAFTSEVDNVLAVSNANTLIEIEY